MLTSQFAERPVVLRVCSEAVRSMVYGRTVYAQTLFRQFLVPGLFSHICASHPAPLPCGSTWIKSAHAAASRREEGPSELPAVGVRDTCADTGEMLGCYGFLGRQGNSSEALVTVFDLQRQEQEIEGDVSRDASHSSAWVL